MNNSMLFFACLLLSTVSGNVESGASQHVSLETKMLVGQVVTNGKPAIGARVMIVTREYGELYRTFSDPEGIPWIWARGNGQGTYTDGNGRFALSISSGKEAALQDGMAAIHFSLGGAVEVISDSLGALNAHGPITMESRPGALIGKMELSADQSPRKYRVVALRHTDDILSKAYPGVFQYAALGEEGVYAFEALPAGDWLIGFQSIMTGRMPYPPRRLAELVGTRLVHVDPGSVTSLDSTAHSSNLPSTGLTIDLSGPAGAKTGMITVYGGGDPWIEVASIYLPGEGEVHVESVRSGSYRLVMVTDPPTPPRGEMHETYEVKGVEGVWDKDSAPVKLTE